MAFQHWPKTGPAMALTSPEPWAIRSTIHGSPGRIYGHGAGHEPPTAARWTWRCRSSHLYSGPDHRSFLCAGILWRRRTRRTQVFQQAPAREKDMSVKEKEQPAAYIEQQLSYLRKEKPLTDAQKDTQNKIMEALKEGKIPLLDGVTGCGKTRILEHVIAELKPKAALVLAPVKELAKQHHRVFQEDFVNESWKTHLFISSTSHYYPNKPIQEDEQDGLKVKRRPNEKHKDIEEHRRATLNDVKGGKPCNTIASTAALWPVRINVNVDAETILSDEERNHIVSQLKEELPGLSGSLMRTVQVDIETLERENWCRNMFDFYQDLLPDRFNKCLIDLMNEKYGDRWLLAVDECHSMIPDLGKAHKCSVTTAEEDVKKGFCRPKKLEWLKSDQQKSLPMSWPNLRDHQLPRNVLLLSATPGAEVEDLGKNGRQVVPISLEHRPTNIPNPEIEIVMTKPNHKKIPSHSHHDFMDLIKNVTKIIEKRIERGQILISCVENWQADVLTYYFQVDNTYTCEALHGLCLGPIKEKILKMLAGKKIRILCGSKQLNEGLDLPGVATVIVCDADSAGFLRTETYNKENGKKPTSIEQIAPGTNPETFPDRKKMDRKKMEKWTLRHYINFLALPWGRLKECLPSKKGLEDNAFKNNDLIRNMQKLLLMCLFDGIAWEKAGNLLDEGKKTFRDIVHMPLSEILKTANVGPKSGQRLHRLAEDDKHKKNLLNVEKAYRIVLSDAKFTSDLRETLKSLNVTSRSSLATKVKSVVEDLKGLENTIVVEAVARLIWLAV
ncbi:unnamed protein product [Durusdinium trenchii]|uniref:Helicase ATP-binding domain-containing protein n=1 Tax=Durusdinium trenchii TaxID=1381693 RepID=A0ABP0PHK6_9DINO